MASYHDEIEYSDSASASSYDGPRTRLLTSDLIDSKVPAAEGFGVSFLFRPLRWHASIPRQLPRRPPRPHPCSRRTLLRTLRALAYLVFLLVFSAILIASTFAPSYTTLPTHYESLKQRARASTEPGRGNPNNHKVFIASSLFDPGGQLLSGAWANNVLHLIDLLGPENTHLSIYENDSGPEAQLALAGFSAQVPCNKSLVFEEHLSPEELPTVVVPDGSKRVKRITYLAEVRNKALKPLDNGTVRFDRVLYLNDVFFDPVDALGLLFSTNVDENGQATYRAACAVDFINPFKFYDTFATRDLGGWGMGVPFFPWFSYGGDSRSHSDVLQGKDAVRVRSCWGGMVAFDARFFQRPSVSGSVPQTVGSESPTNLTAPYRFRAEKDLFWDASECCLIHADIQDLNSEDTGIYMNPFVRCAYDQQTLSWLWFTRRFERLYTPIHVLADIVASLPRLNLRRARRPWQQVEEKVWIPDDGSATGGSFQIVSRVANHASFCGRRNLSVMKQHFTAGEKNYEFIPIPGS